jgi:hypothetical protein
MFEKVFLSTLALAALMVFSVPASARGPLLRHDLRIQVEPKERLLRGRDVLSIRRHSGDELFLFLAPRAEITSLRVNGEEADYEFSRGRLLVPLSERAAGRSSLQATVEYRAVFDDPFEPEPFAMDNPGQGVMGTMTDRGVFLLGGSGWYPLVRGEEVSMELEVEAPRGIRAVTGGRLLGHEDKADRTISRWTIDRAVKPQGLFAGPYDVEHREVGGAAASTYFFPETAGLSERYLEATAGHLRFFEDLHGPYAFAKFAVVENFFPTGYGFPSYTLLGTRVLRLPFIPETSLKHEIAHCWWGNGVMVDYDRGNWSEGLTTYVADYLRKERRSEEEARAYRERQLTDYALLAAGDEDFPLAEFTSRMSPASQAVGYGKSMFVFHMVRRRIGDEAFWAALSRVYEKFLFRRASWSDFRDAFVQASDWEAAEAEDFFEQWVEKSGAPDLSIKDAQRRGVGGAWRVTASIVQGSPTYSLRLPVEVRTENGFLSRVAEMEGGALKLEIESEAKPLSLAVDPWAQVFRLLSRAEIPPTVNSIKGSDELAAILSAGAFEGAEQVYRGLLKGLNHGRARIIAEEDLRPEDLAGADLLFFGYPETEKGRRLLAETPEGVRLSARGFDAGKGFSSENAGLLFAAFKAPERPGRIKAVFQHLPEVPAETVARVARKITHYGNYGLLAFKGAENVAKGALEAGASPLTVRFGE